MIIERNSKLISITAFTASILTVIQIVFIILRGEAVCLNQGCKIIENLTTIPTLYFNIIGFIYFQSLCWLFFLARKKGKFIDLSRLVLITGLAVEGLLISYQLRVAETFCSYCLLIFAIILLLNILAGWKQFIAGITMFSAIVLYSFLLNYGPAVLLSKQQTINSGTYGTRTCLKPQKELYLFFSADCPHCQNVLQALEGCNSCNFHFNPIEKLDNLDLTSINLAASYSPQLNKLLLKLLAIDSIPVLLEKNKSGFSIIKGEQNIINYIKKACYQADPLIYFESSGQSHEEDLSIFSDEGECSMTIECEEE